MDPSPSPHLLHTFLEQVGVDPDQVDKQALEETLYPSVQHRLQEIIQEAKKLMRHSKRDFLTTQDVNFALKKLNVSDVFGYPSHVHTQFHKITLNANEMDQEMDGVSGEQQVLWYQKPQQIDLKDFVLDDQKSAMQQLRHQYQLCNNPQQKRVLKNRIHKLQQVQNSVPLPMTYEMHFTAINGLSPAIPQNIEEIVEPEEVTKKDISGAEQPIPPPHSQIIPTTSDPKPQEDAAQQKSSSLGYLQGSVPTVAQKTHQPSYLTKEMDAFYHIFIDRFQRLELENQRNQVQLTSDQKITEAQTQYANILWQLRTQPSLKDIFVHLIHFVQNKNMQLIQSQTYQDGLTYDMLLDLLETIVDNKFYDVDLHMPSVTTFMMSVIMQQKYEQNTKLPTIIKIKTRCVKLLGIMIRRVVNKNSELRQDCTHILVKALIQIPISHKNSIFGCITALTEIVGGLEPLQQILQEKVPNYQEMLQLVDSMNDSF